MGNIWFISDTHFNHANILKFVDKKGNRIRPEFSCVEDMNETMIRNWNEVVRPGDKIYHLGDVFFGPKEWFITNWPRLMGKKRLVVGNHDRVKFLSSGDFFESVYSARTLGEFGIKASHEPLHPSALERHKYPDDDRMLLNLHGHIHEKDSPKGPYKNLSVEKTNYRPVHIDELRCN